MQYYISCALLTAPFDDQSLPMAQHEDDLMSDHRARAAVIKTPARDTVIRHPATPTLSFPLMHVIIWRGALASTTPIAPSAMRPVDHCPLRHSSKRLGLLWR